MLILPIHIKCHHPNQQVQNTAPTPKLCDKNKNMSF